MKRLAKNSWTTTLSSLGLALGMAMNVQAAAREPVRLDVSAVYERKAQRWTLQPLVGEVLRVQAPACATAKQPEPGIWYVDQFAPDTLELRAASSVEIHAEQQLALRDCSDAASSNAWAVPQWVQSWLREQGGVVQVVK